ncbi:hypothetical protein Tco_0431964 [Tanacetum coccineum]
MITNLLTMAILESCPKHIMVAYLEKSEGNAEFHEVIDFLARSSIYHALIVSPVVSTTFVKQFWMSAKSKIINNVRYITAKVAGKPVSISEASIRSALLFDDADGIDSLPKQAIFDAIDSSCKVFSFMVKKGKHFSGKVTPLFASMLVQSTEDEANVEPQSDQSPRPSHTPHIPDSIPEVSGGNQGVHKDPLFDELNDDEIDNIDTEDAQDVGRSRDVVNEEKENADAEVSTEDVLSTAQQKERIEADRLLAKSLQEEEREHSQVEERAKFRRDTIDCFKEDILLNKDQKLYRK